MANVPSYFKWYLISFSNRYDVLEFINRHQFKPGEFVLQKDESLGYWSVFYYSNEALN